ncbi:MAG: Minor outer membrane protein Omp16 [Pedosphaera sp.]|nr:Minor outer membrane protein Omp16 [Pedosphaera sp.]
MKLTKIFNLMMLGLVLTFTAVGCRHNPGMITQIPGRQTALGQPPGIPSGDRFPVDNNNNTRGTDTAGKDQSIPLGGKDHTGWSENHDALKQQTVYFEFDKSSIKSSEGSKLDEVASYLKSHPEADLKVEGNCDERGTEEYNRSLGERRALAAREYLVRLGIEPSRVDTITYGEDRPAETGHGEAAWSKNRRDEFVVLTAPGKF